MAPHSPESCAGGIAFFVRGAADIDHMVPVMHRLAKDGEKRLAAVYYQTWGTISDHSLLGWIGRHHGIPVLDPWAMTVGLQPRFLAATLLYRLAQVGVPLTGRLFSKTFSRCHDLAWARELLKRLGPRVVVFDHVAKRKLAIGVLSQAARELGIKVVLHPHSVQIFSTLDTDLERMSNLPEADYTISPRRAVIGVVGAPTDPEGKNLALGCARYNREWIAALTEIVHQDFPQPAPAPGDDRIKVAVFSRPTANFTVDDPLVERIGQLPFVNLRAKAKPRGRDRQKGEGQIPSSALIDWADVVVTAGSSIDVEVLERDKLLIFLEYKSRSVQISGQPATRTIPAMRGASASASCENDVLDILATLHADRSWRPSSRETVVAVVNELAYDGDPSRDVLGEYSAFYRSLLA